MLLQCGKEGLPTGKYSWNVSGAVLFLQKTYIFLIKCPSHRTSFCYSFNKKILYLSVVVMAKEMRSPLGKNMQNGRKYKRAADRAQQEMSEAASLMTVVILSPRRAVVLCCVFIGWDGHDACSWFNMNLNTLEQQLKVCQAVSSYQKYHTKCFQHCKSF